MTSKLSYAARAEQASGNPLKSYLLRLIAAKKTNLCVSADVNSTSALLRLAEDVGDSICLFKTHADIVDDFGEKTIKGLREISLRKKFLIFEDRKFGDIGSESSVDNLCHLLSYLDTVQAQYTRGPLTIASWAHLVNAHMFPGPAIVPALKSAADAAINSLRHGVSTEISVGTPTISSEGEEDDDYIDGKVATRRALSQASRKDSIVTNTTIYQTVELSQQTSGCEVSSPAPRAESEAMEELGDPPLARGLLLFAQMSSAGNLMGPDYTKHCIQVARQHKDFVIGYIAQRDLNADSGDDFLSLAPGVQLPPKDQATQEVKGDGLGQQYRTPREVIGKDACDIVIVGRGITGLNGSKEKIKEAERYRAEAWKAYEARIR